MIQAAAGAVLFSSEEQDAYAQVPVNDHTEIYRIRDRAFKRWLMKRMYDETGQAAGSEALSQALNLLEARAYFDGQRRRLSLRAARHDEAICNDLGDERWRSVKAGPEGWEIISSPPPIFRRTANLAPQVDPERPGNLERLLQFVNLERP